VERACPPQRISIKPRVTLDELDFWKTLKDIRFAVVSRRLAEWRRHPRLWPAEVRHRGGMGEGLGFFLLFVFIISFFKITKIPKTLYI
jgi:hypothetical protein